MREKKSETLEVRLPHSQKRAFMDACEAEGTTASEEVRGFIGRFLDERASQPTRNAVMTVRRNPLKTTAAALSLGMGGLVLGTNGASAADPDFERLDRDRNGVLTASEIAPNAEALVAELDSDDSGDLSEAEFVSIGKVASIVSVYNDTPMNGDAVIEGVRIDYDMTGSPVRLAVHERRATVAKAEAEAAVRRMQDELYGIESRLGFGPVGPGTDE